MALKQKYKDQLLSIILKHVPESQIYLFGSRATNKESPGSDIDLAINAPQPIPHKTIIKILLEIDETTIPLKVDLVDLNIAQEPLKQNILQEGILWTK